MIFVGNDKDHPHIHWAEIVFLANYVTIATVINYVLIPRFLYPKKILVFWLLIAGLFAYAVVLEEFILEKIFYPRSRGEIVDIFSAIMEVGSATMILVVVKLAWDATVKQQKIDSLNRMMAESELDYLKQQINPHFLFNNLNNLYAYAIENSPKTPKIILQLSAILRYMLYDCKAKTVSLIKEEENIRSFIELNKLQLEGKGNVNYHSRLDNDYFIAPLILIVFVENAFKHSQAGQSEGIEIDVNIEVQNGELIMQCSNTYYKNENSGELDGGIGLQNVKNRLELIYTDKHYLNIEDSNGKHSVLLKINLNSAEE